MPSASTAHDQPLGMTVHAMPAINSTEVRSANTPSGRWKMILVLLVCASPVVASYFMYYVVRPEGRRNFGELISPQRPLPPLATQTLDGKAGELTALKNQWLLLSVAGGACDMRCEQNLYFQRQLRESLGREKDRLDRVWLVDDNIPVRPALLPALAAATVLRVQPGAVAQWLEPAPGKRLEDHLYLVDPLGNLMMRFPADMDAEAGAKAKRDLDRLLRASSSWDKEGR
ncbi:hypothetical protein IWX87_001719 [Polaromonas sp. CG_9.7]|nr:hypothetical protein [Polaromonas sp. CG_9.7]MBG6113968.1 hypothetical protein [Polaromonas sp. CG_9.2]MDH6183886.1 hypothetical protein [Polaromonas sp. CG_23.6]